jgi:hypothetical protein
MATQTIEFEASGGQTLTAKAFAAGSDVEAGSAAATEATNRKGTYTVSFTGLAGTYKLIALSGTTPVATARFVCTDITATFPSGDLVSAVATDAINAAALAADAVTEISTKVRADLITDHGSGSWASIGAGSGARTITVTVDDGTTAVQSAIVRLTKGVETYTATTNASGLATLNIDDGTWIVSITRSGYSFSGASLVVTASASVTYSMSIVVVVAPSDPLLSALNVLCLNGSFVATAGIVIDMRIITVPVGDVNIAYGGLKTSATSGADGMAALVAPKGSVIEFKRGTTNVWERLTIGSGGSTNVTSFIGSP